MTKARDLANASTALSAVSATELGYLDGVTSAVQTQIDTKLATTTAASTYEPALPSQTGNSGKYLTTNGTSKSWGTVASAPDFLAGKNKVINGDFGIWQRGTSFSGSLTYTADRFVGYSDASQTYSRQSFTAGTAPVAGYEGQYFWRGTKGGTGTFISLYQLIEGVRTFAGQTVTISFWTKADSAQTLYIRPVQNFGTGGSTGVIADTVSVSVGTSWSRVSATITFPSIAGKTIGANNHILLETYIVNNGSLVWDVWGVQAEVGSAATPFTTATGTIQGELAACQRYYQRIGTGDFVAIGISAGSSQAYFTVPLPVEMRTITSVDYSNLKVYTGNAFGTVSAIGFQAAEPSRPQLSVVGSSFNSWGYALSLSATYIAFIGEL